MRSGDVDQFFGFRESVYHVKSFGNITAFDPGGAPGVEFAPGDVIGDGDGDGTVVVGAGIGDGFDGPVGLDNLEA